MCTLAAGRETNRCRTLAECIRSAHTCRRGLSCRQSIARFQSALVTANRFSCARILSLSLSRALPVRVSPATTPHTPHIHPHPRAHTHAHTHTSSSYHTRTHLAHTHSLSVCLRFSQLSPRSIAHQSLCINLHVITIKYITYWSSSRTCIARPRLRFVMRLRHVSHNRRMRAPGARAQHRRLKLEILVVTR